MKRKQMDNLAIALVLSSVVLEGLSVLVEPEAGTIGFFGLFVLLVGIVASLPMLIEAHREVARWSKGQS